MKFAAMASWLLLAHGVSNVRDDAYGGDLEGRMRNAAGHWLEVEAWINQQCGAAFTHGICPDCRVQVVAER